MRPSHATTVIALVDLFILSIGISDAFISGCSTWASRGKPATQVRAVGAPSPAGLGVQVQLASPVSANESYPTARGSGRSLEEEKEKEEELLREGLPGYAKEWQLRETLAQCELTILADAPFASDVKGGETVGIENVAISLSVGEVRTEDAVADPLSDASTPLGGLRRFASDGMDGVFMGAAGVPLRYRLFPKYSTEGEGGALRPGVVLLTGLMETMAKYGETIAYLNDRGFSVYTYDHHGQGLSGRLLVPASADPTVAHITDFQHYVDDLIHFSRVVLPATVPRYSKTSSTAEAIQSGQASTSATETDTRSSTGGIGIDSSENARGRDCNRGAVMGEERRRARGASTGDGLELSIVAHSMGGLMAVYATLEDPLLFNGVVLAAPMMAPNTGRLANVVVGLVAWIATKLGHGHRSPIRRPAQPSMEWSKVTHDKNRLRLWEGLRSGVDCVLQRGPSFAWLSQAVSASKRVRRRFAQLSVPMLVLEAGLDGMVRSDAIQRFRQQVPSAEYRLFAGAYHDIFDETDDIRLQVLEETRFFLSSLEAPEPDL